MVAGWDEEGGAWDGPGRKGRAGIGCGLVVVASIGGIGELYSGRGPGLAAIQGLIGPSRESYPLWIDFRVVWNDFGNGHPGGAVFDLVAGTLAWPGLKS